MKKISLLLFTIIVMVSVVLAEIPAPTNLTVSYKVNTPGTVKGFVELKWQYAVPPNTNPATFKVLRKKSGTTEFSVVASALKTLYFNDYSVEFAKTYNYFVVAMSGNQVSKNSDTVSITTPAVPPTPEFVQFISEPVRTGTINIAYVYNAKAKSSDSTAVIKYFLGDKPTGMTIDSLLGTVNWTPAASGKFNVSINAKSSKGGSATQVYSISVTTPPLPKGFVKGFVLQDSTNAPLVKAAVYLVGASANAQNVVYTNELGYFFASVTVGTYKVKFAKEGYIAEYYNNKLTLETADSVKVLANDTTKLVASLAKVLPPVMYTLSGTVLNATGQPVKGKVTAMYVKPTTPTPVPIMPEPSCGYTTGIDSLGKYKFNLPGGREYIIFVAPADPKYLPEYWDNKREYTLADKILLNANKPDVNFVMDLKPVYANGINGSVKHFTGAQEGVFANVTAYKLAVNGTKYVKSVLTDSLGVYSMVNLEPGKYILRALPKFPYLPGYYKVNGVAFEWRKADTVVVTETSVVPNINIKLKARTDSGWGIANGKVMVNNSEQGVLGSLVYVLDASGEVINYAISGDDGSYSVEGLSAGTYKLEADIIDYDNSVLPQIVVDNELNTYKVDINITPTTPTAVEDKDNLKPVKFELAQNYPNPFNPTTTIKYSVAEKSFITLRVFNVLGKELKTLVSGVKEPGQYSINFNASEFNSGVYFYKLETGTNSITKKMLLVK